MAVRSWPWKTSAPAATSGHDAAPAVDDEAPPGEEVDRPRAPVVEDLLTDDVPDRPDDGPRCPEDEPTRMTWIWSGLRGRHDPAADPEGRPAEDPSPRPIGVPEPDPRAAPAPRRRDALDAEPVALLDLQVRRARVARQRVDRHLVAGRGQGARLPEDTRIARAVVEHEHRDAAHRCVPAWCPGRVAVGLGAVAASEGARRTGRDAIRERGRDRVRGPGRPQVQRPGARRRERRRPVGRCEPC